jgi:hypothetical protein
MVEETKEEPKEEPKEEAKGILDEVRAEREALDKTRAEAEQTLNELKEFRSQEILSGKSDAGQKKEEMKKMTDKEYAEAISKGIIPES